MRRSEAMASLARDLELSVAGGGREGAGGSEEEEEEEAAAALPAAEASANMSRRFAKRRDLVSAVASASRMARLTR